MTVTQAERDARIVEGVRKEMAQPKTLSGQIGKAKSSHQKCQNKRLVNRGNGRGGRYQLNITCGRKAKDYWIGGALVRMCSQCHEEWCKVVLKARGFLPYDGDEEVDMSAVQVKSTTEVVPREPSVAEEILKEVG